MIQRQFLPDNLKKLARAAVALCIVLVAVMLVAGCTLKPASENHTKTLTIIPNPISETPESRALYKVTLAQEEGSHSDLIGTDSDVYNPGEVIEFSLPTDKMAIQPCKGDISSFRVFFRSVDGSWEELPGPFNAYRPYVAPQPASTAFPGRGHQFPNTGLLLPGGPRGITRFSQTAFRHPTNFS